MVQPVAQQPAAHRGGAGIEQREQRRRFAAAQRLGQFEIAARGGVQANEFGFVFDRDALHMTQRLALRAGRIVQQRAGRAECCAQRAAAERIETGDAQLLAQATRAGILVEVPLGQAGARARVRRQFDAIGVQQLGGADALQLPRQLCRLAFHQPQFAAGEVEPGQPGLADAAPHRLLVHRHQEGIGLVRQQRCVGQRAGSDDPDHLALDRALAGGRIADLLADRHRLAQLDQLGQILVDRMEGDAGHADRHAVGAAARGQRDVEQPRGLLGVVVEQLVEIAHPVEEQGVRMVGLDAQILLHHRRVFFRGTSRCAGGRGSWQVFGHAILSAGRCRRAAAGFGACARPWASHANAHFTARCGRERRGVGGKTVRDG